MNKSDFFKILKLTLLSLIVLYLSMLSRFNFKFDTVSIVPILKFSPVFFLAFWVCCVFSKSRDRKKTR
ncbi:hypothetical protein BKK51_09390 [Rodentibacter trehalosifermentans]|uniref:UDP-diphosphatase n=1 Tax=Rodentibacter trehalosifermentans TaxID=1908263 RepID=A0A1V3IPV9_9PAST|nr:hypothetical protein BKK51_09390 [Rodentibacter trehalosifermentans]